MFNAHQEHQEFNYATEQDWDNADAREVGEANPTQCWISTDRDVWHKNPFYVGVESPHPESDATDDEWRAWTRAQAEWMETQARDEAQVRAYNHNVATANNANAL